MVGGVNVPEHSAAKRRLVKKGTRTPDDFDERAKTNTENVAKIHEFRRENIRDYEPPEKDFFDYDSEEKSRKYDGFKMESIFKYSATMKAIKWGVTVGGLFAMHRYYRTRSINNAAFWFGLASSVSFFNIWLSYSLQEQVIEMASKKSISVQQRIEYQQGAYQAYITRVADETTLLDKDVEPKFSNDGGKSLAKFTDDYINITKERFGTENMSKEEILDFAKNHPFKDHKKLQLTEKEAGFSWVVENSELIRYKELDEERTSE